MISLALLIRFFELRDGNIRARKEHGISDTEAPSLVATEPDKAAHEAVLEVSKAEAVATTYTGRYEM
jgi:hypothetical protein